MSKLTIALFALSVTVTAACKHGTSEAEKIRNDACACKDIACARAVAERYEAAVDANWKQGGGASKSDMKAMAEAGTCIDKLVGSGAPSTSTSGDHTGTSPLAATARDATTDSPDMAAARQVVEIYKHAIDVATTSGGDCAKFGASLEPLHKDLWALGTTHAGVFRKLTDGQLASLGAADTQEAVAEKLIGCKDTKTAKEFAIAMGRML